MRNHTYKTGGDFMWEVNDLIWGGEGKNSNGSCKKLNERHY